MPHASDICFHCGLVNDAGEKYPVDIDGKTEYMCCPGCQAVCEAILSLGLDDYYKFRENLPETSPRDMPAELEQLDFYDHEKVQKKFVTIENEHTQSIALLINGIVCAACTWLIESRISRLAGIVAVSVNQSTSRASVSWDPEQISLSEILKAINELGYQAHPYDQRLREEQLILEKKRALKRLAVAGLGMMQVMMYSLGFYLDANVEMSESTYMLLRWVSLLISAPVVLYAASPFYLSAWKSLTNLSVNMDVPVTLAIFSAWLASLWATVSGHGEVYFDSVSMFVFFLLTGRYLQMIAIHRSGRVLEERLKSKPETAIKLINDEQTRVLLDDVKPGDHLLVKSGQQIPCDGNIVSGNTSVDESILTGESIPKLKNINDKVAAGSVNTGNVISIKVTSDAANSTLTGIINLLQKAQQSKPEIQLLANKIASYFVSTVLVLAFCTGLFWYWQDSSQIFNTVLAVLVVTCPCALSLATPVAITTGLGRLTEQSLLVNKTSALLNMSELTDIVFDKTGTLTTGRFKLKQLINLSSKSDDELLDLISVLESYSDHPVATAFEYLQTSKQKLQAKEIKILPATGIEGVIDNQKWYFGNQSVLDKATCPENLPQLKPGQLLLFLVKDDSDNELISNERKCKAIVVVETEIREDAKATIEQLQKSGLQLHLLSGDQSENVQQIAENLGFHHWSGEQSPEDKLDYINRLDAAGSKAAMIGDGINDSPAMAAALVSLAMAKSTDITKVSADIIMLNERLSLLTDAITTSKAVHSVIKQNLLWALAYNLLGLPLAVSGILTPWLAAAGMSLSSLVVVLNALRLSKIGISRRS